MYGAWGFLWLALHVSGENSGEKQWLLKKRDEV
jgi:hypothetical protein